jgi:hypothetical protein
MKSNARFWMKVFLGGLHEKSQNACESPEDPGHKQKQVGQTKDLKLLAWVCLLQDTGEAVSEPSRTGLHLESVASGHLLCSPTMFENVT